MAEHSLLDRFSRRILELDSKALPKQVQKQAQLLILDILGVAMATLDEHEVANAVTAVLSTGGAPQATVIGAKGKTSIGNAVVANGILVRYLDMNDFTLGEGKGGVSIGGHPSDNIPIAIAAGEAHGSSGADVLASIVVGYEVFERLRTSFDNKGVWDGTSCSGVVAAAMAGRLMGLNVDQMRHAIAIAAMRSPTPRLVRSGHITAAKFLANPLVAQAGIMGAILAKAGMTGPQAILEDTKGLRTLFRDNTDFAILDAAMGEPPFAINLAHVKAFPCLATGQAETAAAIEMHKFVKGRIGEIESFDVIMADYHQVRDQQGDQARRYPDSREAADHSFYFLAAAGMMDGTLTMHSYDNARWTQPDVTALMAKARMVIDPTWNARAPLGYPCRIEVTMKDGAKHHTEVAYAPGHSKGALEEAAVFEKFDRLTKGVIDEKRQTQVKELVMKLDTAPSVAPLMELVGNLK